ncbi:MAG: hypothetical protein MZV49_24375 [Rhodopseudomonas palustris]|nr:hypothetical protein [Rhodopseudomonas palustris]
MKSAQDQEAARDQYDFAGGASRREGRGTMAMRKAIYDYYLMFKPPSCSRT